jgi:hypothetical protein
VRYITPSHHHDQPLHSPSPRNSLPYSPSHTYSTPTPMTISPMTAFICASLSSLISFACTGKKKTAGRACQARKLVGRQVRPLQKVAEVVDAGKKVLWGAVGRGWNQGCGVPVPGFVGDGQELGLLKNRESKERDKRARNGRCQCSGGRST